MKSLRMFAVATLLAATTWAARAEEVYDVQAAPACSSCQLEASCPTCETPCSCDAKVKSVCAPHRAMVKRSKVCWEPVEKKVCIPGIKFPWSCKPTEGRVRTIKVLKYRTVEYEKCGYEYNIEDRVKQKKCLLDFSKSKCDSGCGEPSCESCSVLGR
ncbi:hypothetical protein Pan216_04710 [Planctomycetes bacterium Pan216]|uniref:4Fe-4S ferredoxin-type domain-containing protein n=1 Tax=Kolteria novifilia TaxID=2527975 RepID=A0A518AY74_9BACT|nr:hypothetical protein Pan216_04710 [Planctomycetes bacterium Pan216]